MEQDPNPETISNGREIADLISEFGEDFGFDTETCEEIAEMPFEDAFEATYGYLAQAGLDPDEVLAPFMEQSEE